MRSEGRELSLFIFLLVAGLALANLALVALALLPLLMLLLGRGEGLEVAMAEDVIENRDISSGDELTVRRGFRAGEGTGLVVISDPLPPCSSLVSGSNVRVLWKGDDKPLEADFSYVLSIRNRGRFRIGPCRATSFSPSIDWPARSSEGDDAISVVVRDRAENMRAVSSPRTLPRLPMPEMITGMLGAQTTEFMDLREYTPGDRYRNINWKATSRSAGEGQWPLVNSYKVEENRNTLILLDNGQAVAGDVFERCVHAAMGLSQIYLANRVDVGLLAVDSGEAVRPAGGRRQELLISQRLLDMKVTDAGGRISDVGRAFPEQLRSGPLIIIVTSVRREGSAGLGEEIRLLRSSMGRRGKVLLINVRDREAPAEGIVGILAQDLVDLGTSSHERDLASLGVPVHTWDPRDGDFSEFIKREFGVPG